MTSAVERECCIDLQQFVHKPRQMKSHNINETAQTIKWRLRYLEIVTEISNKKIK